MAYKHKFDNSTYIYNSITFYACIMYIYFKYIGRHFNHRVLRWCIHIQYWSVGSYVLFHQILCFYSKMQGSANMEVLAVPLNCILFADDTTIYYTSNDKTTLQRNIENDMTSLANWFYANKLSLNIKKKTIFWYFLQQNRDNVMTPIKIGNQQILQVRTTKFLGIYIDDELEWGTTSIISQRK